MRLEACLGDDGLHLGVDASDFAKADIVHFIGGQGRGGVMANRRPIIALTVRQVPSSQSRLRLGQIFLFQELSDSPLSGDHLLFEDVQGGCSERGLEVTGNAGRQMIQRRQKRTGFSIGRSLFLCGSQSDFDNELRLDEPCGQPAARIDDMLIIVAGQRPQARQIGVGFQLVANDGLSGQTFAEAGEAPVRRKWPSARIKRRHFKVVGDRSRQ